MKLFLHSGFLAILVLVVPPVYGQAKEYQEHSIKANSTYESIWLWSVDTPNRRIYIAGELHDHFLAPNEVLSHKLANSAYELSSNVMLETIGMKRLSSNQVKHRVTPQTWAALVTAIRKALSNKQNAMKNLSEAERNLPNEEVIEFVNRLPDSLLLDTLLALLLPMPETQPSNFNLNKGFLRKISEEAKKYPDKFSFLEDPDAGNKAWTSNCSQSNDTEMLVFEILSHVDKNADHKKSTLLQLSQEFKNPNGTTKSYDELQSSTPFWKTITRCNIFPRNLAWIKKIKPEINKGGRPLMIVAGISHVIGDSGLLSMLCKEGYCKSHRVLRFD